MLSQHKTSSNLHAKNCSPTPIATRDRGHVTSYACRDCRKGRRQRRHIVICSLVFVFFGQDLAQMGDWGCYGSIVTRSSRHLWGTISRIWVKHMNTMWPPNLENKRTMGGWRVNYNGTLAQSDSSLCILIWLVVDFDYVYLLIPLD